MASEDEEKSEDPTAKKLEDARKKGDVARSRELSTFLMMLAAGLLFVAMGEGMMADFQAILTLGFSFERNVATDMQALSAHVGLIMEHVVSLLIPIFLLLFVVALISPALLGGWVFATESLGFKLEKINPVKGLGRMFSMNALVELLKTLAKFVLVMSLAVWILWVFAVEVIFISREGLTAALAHAGQLLVMAFLVLSLALFVIALIDVPWQLYSHSKKLKMSLQDIKDEFKQTEGNPEIKGRIRQIQYQMTQKRMMQAVPEAAVVITNPTHYAVALKYKPEEGMRVPVVIAAGADLMALQIRNVASSHAIPQVRFPPLARSLYYNVELNQEIPEGLYALVAKLLAQVMQLENQLELDGTQFDAQEIPVELRRDDPLSPSNNQAPNTP
jgi:flagellar biosynthetic protein FlhB